MGFVLIVMLESPFEEEIHVKAARNCFMMSINTQRKRKKKSLFLTLLLAEIVHFSINYFTLFFSLASTFEEDLFRGGFILVHSCRACS